MKVENRKMVIEKLQEKDIQAAQDFMLQIIKDDFGYDFNPQWHADIVNLKELYMQDERACFYVLKSASGEVIGTIAARSYDRFYPEFINRYNSTETISIWRHYIKKEYRGLGYGTKLLQEVVQFAKDGGFSHIYLHTQKTIPGSLEYWIAKGFIVTIKNEDALQTVHLEKSLTHKG